VIAAALAVQHHHFVMVVDLLRIPVRRKLRLEKRVGGSDGDRRRDEGQAQRHPVVVTVDGQRALA
jgi:hypothetical protein